MTIFTDSLRGAERFREVEDDAAPGGRCNRQEFGRDIEQDHAAVGAAQLGDAIRRIPVILDEVATGVETAQEYEDRRHARSPILFAVTRLIPCRSLGRLRGHAGRGKPRSASRRR